MSFTGLAVATGPAAFSSEGDQAGGGKKGLSSPALNSLRRASK